MHRKIKKILLLTVLSVMIVSGTVVLIGSKVLKAEAGGPAMAASSNVEDPNRGDFRLELVPCGFTFGVKLYTQGVVIVGMTPVQTESGDSHPAADAGLKIGDIINTVNGKKIDGVTDLNSIIAKNGKKEVIFNITRKGETQDIKITPVIEKDTRKNRIGVWARDSSAGIGTMTFYHPDSEIFGGLGHGICDIDTGELLPVRSGTILKANVSDIKRGEQGAPGELKGKFINEQILGTLIKNSNTGIFSKSTIKAAQISEPVPIAYRDEIQAGSAQIYCNVSGEEVKAYDIEIVRVLKNTPGSSKNMVIRVTDPELLNLTGGIVQGMSGSPIMQNGMLVGAVTHVLVNDPTRGFGIFIENMLENINEEMFSGIESTFIKDTAA